MLISSPEAARPLPDGALISTAFAPLSANQMSDASFARLATLADELDAGVLIDLHQSSEEIEQCQALTALGLSNACGISGC